MRLAVTLVAFALVALVPGAPSSASAAPAQSAPPAPAPAPAPKKKPRLGVEVGKADGQGVRVVRLVKDALAEKIGMMPNDILLEVDGARITSVLDFVEKVNAVKPGAVMSIRGLRDEKEIVFSAKLP